MNIKWTSLSVSLFFSPEASSQHWVETLGRQHWTMFAIHSRCMQLDTNINCCLCFISRKLNSWLCFIRFIRNLTSAAARSRKMLHSFAELTLSKTPSKTPSKTLWRWNEKWENHNARLKTIKALLDVFIYIFFVELQKQVWFHWVRT